MSIRQCIFPDKLKTADILSNVIKKMILVIRQITDLLVFFQPFQKFLRNVYSIRFQTIVKIFYHHTFLDFGRDYSTQYTLPEMIKKKWKNCLDNSGVF